TAYSVGRAGPSGAASLLPMVKTSTKHGFLGLPTERDYTLIHRDGPVYVQVRRWDEDHMPIYFPYGSPGRKHEQLWQSLLHNPQSGVAAVTGAGIVQTCRGISIPGSSDSVGFGLQDTTISALKYLNDNGKLIQKDLDNLSSAFMLNDRGDGLVDHE